MGVKFYPSSPCPTLWRPEGGTPLKRPYGRRPPAIFYPFRHPTPYASAFNSASPSLQAPCMRPTAPPRTFSCTTTSGGSCAPTTWSLSKASWAATSGGSSSSTRWACAGATPSSRASSTGCPKSGSISTSSWRRTTLLTSPSGPDSFSRVLLNCQVRFYRVFVCFYFSNHEYSSKHPVTPSNCFVCRISSMVHRFVELFHRALPSGGSPGGSQHLRSARGLGRPHGRHRRDLPMDGVESIGVKTAVGWG
jgi:hypothetical protein